MGPDAGTTALPTSAQAGAGALLRCPDCAAVARPGAPWCTQCFLDLRPAPEPAPAPAAPVPVAAVPTAPVPAAAPDPAAPARPDALPDGDPTWPCTACGSTTPLAADVCAACGSPFLAGLRATEPPLLVLPGVGDVAALSRARRLGLAAGAALAVAGSVLALGLL